MPDLMCLGMIKPHLSKKMVIYINQFQRELKIIGRATYSQAQSKTQQTERFLPKVTLVRTDFGAMMVVKKRTRRSRISLAPSAKRPPPRKCLRLLPMREK